MGKFGSLLQNQGDKQNIRFFLFTKGKYTGGEFSFPEGAELLIGREITADVALIDSKVSRQHAVIYNNGGVVFLEDKESTNGTFINGKQIPAKVKTVLNSGDIIAIGDSSFVYTAEKNKESFEHKSPAEEEFIIEEHDISDKNADLLSEIDLGDDDLDLGDLESDIFESDDVDDEMMPAEEKSVNIAKIELAKKAVEPEFDVLEKKPVISDNSESSGAIPEQGTISLLTSLLHSGKTGTIRASIEKPFKILIEIEIEENKITGIKGIRTDHFVKEKIFTRFLLAKGGTFKFSPHEKKSLKPDSDLTDIFKEAMSQTSMLKKYKKIVSTDSLRFMIPITGKLSEMSKTELETLQFMVNTREVIPYLNMFPENDDFILLYQIDKFIESGILFGDNNEELEEEVPDDILDI